MANFLVVRMSLDPILRLSRSQDLVGELNYILAAGSHGHTRPLVRRPYMSGLLSIRCRVPQPKRGSKSSARSYCVIPAHENIVQRHPQRHVQRPDPTLIAVKYVPPPLLVTPRQIGTIS